MKKKTPEQTCSESFEMETEYNKLTVQSDFRSNVYSFIIL